MADREDNEISEQLLKAGLGLIFCAAMGAALVQAAYRILSPWELSAYRASRGGSLPYWPIAASVHLLGDSAVAVRAPLLLLFAVLMAGALWRLYRGLRSRLSAETVLLGLAVCLVAMAVQQWISMKRVRIERHEFLAVKNYLARCVAPGETLVVGDDGFAMQLNWYGSENMEEGLAGLAPGASAKAQAAAVDDGAETAEFVFVGNGERAAAANVIPRGYALARDAAMPGAIADALKVVSGDHEAAVYFVARGASSEGSAVSSNP